MSNTATKIADLLRAVTGKPKKYPKTAAIILAAGSSVRMGGDIPKQLIEVEGLPVVIHTLLAFEESKYVSNTVLVVPEGDEDHYRSLAIRHGIKKLTAITVGSDTRHKSAQKGFKLVEDDVKYVAIHDAARCLVTPEIIDRVCAAAVKYNAATAATRAVDTVKISGKNKFVDHTEDRNHVWLAQTPQVFDTDLYRAATYLAESSHIQPTDDNSLIENVKHKVRLVECGRLNVKITTPDDLTVASAVIRSRAKNGYEPLPEDTEE